MALVALIIDGIGAQRQLHPFGQQRGEHGRIEAAREHGNRVELRRVRDGEANQFARGFDGFFPAVLMRRGFDGEIPADAHALRVGGQKVAGRERKDIAEGRFSGRPRGAEAEDFAPAVRIHGAAHARRFQQRRGMRGKADRAVRRRIEERAGLAHAVAGEQQLFLFMVDDDADDRSFDFFHASLAPQAVGMQQQAADGGVGIEQPSALAQLAPERFAVADPADRQRRRALVGSMPPARERMPPDHQKRCIIKPLQRAGLCGQKGA